MKQGLKQGGESAELGKGNGVSCDKENWEGIVFENC